VVLEYGLESICVAYPSFFKCFWKCYLGKPPAFLYRLV
jgi:hypothetical protein